MGEVYWEWKIVCSLIRAHVKCIGLDRDGINVYHWG